MSTYTFDVNDTSEAARLASIKWLIGHLSKNKIKFLYMIIGNLAVNGLQMLIPYYIGIMIDEAIVPKDRNLLEYFVFLILFLGVVMIIVSYTTVYVTNSVAWTGIKNIREEFFETIQAKPLRFHNRVLSGDLMALATNDMNMLGYMINPGIRLVAQAFLGLAAALILSFTVSPLFTLGLIPFFILYLLAIRSYNNKMNPISQTFMTKWAYISRSAQDSIIGMRVVRAFNGEEYEVSKFKDVVLDFKDAWDKRQMLTAKYWPLLMIYLIIGVSFVGSIFMVNNGLMTLGQLISINGMLLMLVPPTFIISFAINMTQGGLAGGGRIFHTMYSYDPEEDKTRVVKPWPAKVYGKINLENVSFKYEGTNKYVLNNINLEVLPGETVALVGPTGSGKTSLTKLISRFYIYEGKIKLDDVDIQEYKLRDLRKNMGRVEQDIFLFASSIKENITFGMEEGTVTDEEIINAAKIAQAHDFIMEQEKGYDTILGERGIGLSGGQKQRIAIARCILTNPPIMILDDSTSAIDSETEEKIAKAMDNVTENRTTFLITHRLSAIRKADKIVVLKDGEIKAVGKHFDLLKTSADYRRIYSKHLELPEIKQLIKEDE